MHYAVIESLIERKIGLSPASIGSKTVTKAIRQRMAACGTGQSGKYALYLESHPKEWHKLIELLVVPETWFFRNRASFDYLSRYVKNEWLKINRNKTFKILSMPCATGEEAYSAVMALMDTGVEHRRIRMDAADVSIRSLNQAMSGFYTRESFRGENLSFRKRYFTAGHADTGFRLNENIRNKVRFIRGNLLDDNFLSESPPYDVIFCRNLLIYLSEPAKKRAMRNIRRLLNKNGLLFIGHAEHSIFRKGGFECIPNTRAFACRIVKDNHDRQSPATDYVFQNTEYSVAEPKLADSAPPRTECGYAETKTGINNMKPVFEDKLKTAKRLADKGRLMEAVHYCLKYLKKHPADVHGHFLAGMIYQALGNEKKARKFLDKSVYLDPDHYEALEQLALIADHRGNRRRAAHLRTRAGRARKRGRKT